MILVLSYSGDAGTTQVLKWLNYYSVPYVRLNLMEENYENLTINISNEKREISLFCSNGKTLNLSEITYTFFRGGCFRYDVNYQNETNIFEDHLFTEFQGLTNYFYEEFSKNCLGNITEDNQPRSKLAQLELAPWLDLKYLIQ